MPYSNTHDHIPGKTKDVNAMQDYFECKGHLSELWPHVMMHKKRNRTEEVRGSDKGKDIKKKMGNVKNYLPPACYTLSKEEKRTFYESLYGIKFRLGTHPT